MKKTWRKRLVQIISGILLMAFGSFGVSAQTGDFQTTGLINCFAIATEDAYIYCAGYATGLSGSLPEGSLDLGGGMRDIWLVKLDREGNLVSSALIGGSGDEAAYSLVVRQGVVYILGETWSTDFPGAPGNAGENDTIVLALAADGSGILWARRLGGSDQDAGRALVLQEEALYLTGITWSQDLVPGEAKGNADGFLAKLGLDGSLDWVRIFGGSDLDAPFDLAISGDFLWVAGQSYSNDFGSSYLGGGDAFAVRFSSEGDQEFVGFYGGREEDVAYSIAPTTGEGIYLAGSTLSSNLGSASGSYGGNYDGFVMGINAAGVVDSTYYLGGTGIDYAHDLHLLSSGNLLVVGVTYSPSFPLGYDRDASSIGGGDGFIVHLDLADGSVDTWIEGSSEKDVAYQMELTSSDLWLAGQFSLDPYPFALRVSAEQFAGVPLPTPLPSLPTATLALTATPLPTETPRPAMSQTATQLPASQMTLTAATAASELTATAEADATLGEPPSSTASATPTQEATSIGEETSSQTLSAGETETAADEEEITSGSSQAAVEPTATTQIEGDSQAKEDTGAAGISSGLLIGGSLLVAAGLGVAYTLIQRKKKRL